GAPMDRICIGHSADSTDVNYLEELLNAGVYLSMDRYQGRAGRPGREQRNATVAALVGLLVQVGLAIFVWMVGLYAESSAILAASWYLFGGLPIWGILMVVYYQHGLERLETLEAEQLARADARTAAIFDEAGQQLQIARNRLEKLYKFGLPIVSIIVALYLLIFGLVQFSGHWRFIGTTHLEAAALGNPEAQTALVSLLLIVVVALPLFLVSRYISGMTQVPEWALLRGGASYLMGNAAIILLLAGAAIFHATTGNPAGFAIMAVIVPAFMGLLGLEVLVGFVFRVYRPRRPGETIRPAFDSRILGWLTRPESLGKIVSETLNYQFGFEISRSWFYQLLARAITPLIVIGVLVLIGASSLVIVAPHEQAVITSFGRLDRIVEPGIYTKLPWPFGRAEKYDVYRVHELSVGSLSDARAHHEAVLWTQEHEHGEETNFLLTAPSRAFDDTDDDTVAGELVGAQVVINYRIADLERYTRVAAEPETLLEQIAGREVNTYFVMRDIGTLLSEDRIEGGRYLRRRIQEQVNRVAVERTGGGVQRGLGLEVVFVGLVGIHPPQGEDVAAKFHEQISAIQERESQIEEARKQEISILAEVAGSADDARELRRKIEDLREMENRMERLRLDGQHDGEEGETLARQIAEQQVAIEVALDEARGLAAQRIHEARAYRWNRVLTEQGRAARFSAQVKAHEQAPDYFRMRHYLATLAEGMPARRKYIVAGEQKGEPTIRLNLESSGSSLESVFQADE
ncbi:MAG: SPFH domain-containing protein, partial [Phycisphaeraceae bacterium]